MRRTLLTLALFTLPAAACAQNTNTTLPVQSVSLFSSGVAFVERGGDVDGDASVLLSLPTGQINDILKSLVLVDTAGTVQPVVYGARDPLSKTLQGFAIDLTGTPSRADLLQKLRGVPVLVTLTNNTTLSGPLVSVEDHTITGPNNTTQTASYLNIFTDAGLAQVALSDTRTVKIADPRLDKELRDALTALASGTDDTRRPVTLHFSGRGRRPVRMGYVSEAPLWKISYRLLLQDGPLTNPSPRSGERGKNDLLPSPFPKGEGPGEGAQSSTLQGWALVENTSDDDWNGITLTLVNGRPVSFIQDLYQPLYLPRPTVAPDITASPTPQTHDAALEDSGGVNAPAITGGPPMAESAPAPMSAAREAANSEEQQRIRINGAGDGITLKSQPSNFYQNTDRFFASGNSVRAQATGADAGEQYAYHITTPVTLPRRQAAMIPVVAQAVDAHKVLLYNADSDPRNPLDAVQLHNTTSLHLKGGPVTLLDDGTYAGDAQMGDVPPGGKRLISYALDLSVHGARDYVNNSQRRVSLSIRHGVLIETVRNTSTVRYTFKSEAAGERTLLIEHPYDPNAKLIAPATYDERTADLYRFALPILPGKTATLDVITETPQYSQFALLDADFNLLAVYIKDGDIPASTRAALEEVVARRRRVLDLTAQADAKDAAVNSFNDEQSRIRRNMAALDKASALYKRYVGELDAQETQIQTLRSDAARLRSEAQDAQASLRAYLDTLTLE